MRENMGKYRGMRTDGKGWVFGHLSGFKQADGEILHEIHNIEQDSIYIIDPETVGQSTGLRDKNGVEIYEHDKLKQSPDYSGIQVDVWWDNECARWASLPTTVGRPNMPCTQDWVVCGNIHTTPELLEGGES